MRWRSAWLMAVVVASACSGGRGLPEYAHGLLGYPAPEKGVEMAHCGLAGEGSSQQCFNEAIEAGRAAEIVLLDTTLEGDPVFRIVRRLGPGSVKVYHDITQDRFGVPPLRFVVECVSVNLLGSATVELTGCDFGNVTGWDAVATDRARPMFWAPDTPRGQGPEPLSRNVAS